MNNIRRTRAGNVVINREISEISNNVRLSNVQSRAYEDIRLVGVVSLPKYKSNLVLFKIKLKFYKRKKLK